MAPPIGHEPYEGAGRRGYEWEQQSLEKMRKILDRDLKMVDKIQEEEEIDDKTQKKLILLKERIKIYSDKLHIPKVDLTTKGESINVNPKTLEIAKKYEEELKKTLNG
jgi:hypothetical protein